MKIKSYLVLEKDTGDLTGFDDLGDPDKDLDPEDENLGSHALVLDL